MLELGNEAQVRSALEGKSGFDKGIENELIRRVAIVEKEQEEYRPLSKGAIILLTLSGVAGVVLSVLALL